jgi:hypothetical protein
VARVLSLVFSWGELSEFNDEEMRWESAGRDRLKPFGWVGVSVH